MSDALIFFSTHYVNGKQDNDDFLFRPDWIEAIGSEDRERVIYRLKDSPTVFARKALSSGAASADTVSSDLIDDVKLAWSSLSAAAQKTVKQVFLFIHANELEGTNSISLLSSLDDFYRGLQLKLRLDSKEHIYVFNFRHGKRFFTDDILRYENPQNSASYIVGEARKYLATLEKIPVSERAAIFEKIQANLSASSGIEANQIVHWNGETDSVKVSSTGGGIRLLVAYLPPVYLPKLEKLLGLLEDWMKVQEEPVPVLFYGKYDLFKESISEEGLNIDARYRYLDASIWFRYLSKRTIKEGGNELTQVIEQIAEGLKRNVHYAVVAQEYREFNWRLFQNAYLKKTGDFGGHASSITPFAFHSETAMSDNATDREREVRGFGVKWDALLVDDYALSHLRATNENADGQTPKKEGLIRVLLGDVVQKLTSVTTVADAKKVISQAGGDKDVQVYDIILLDYLFSRGQEDEPAFGTTLLEEISLGQISHGKAANFKYWVFPVSVFSEALASDLQEKGIQYQETHWVLSRGADPVNTPQLFRASLLEFMQLQYDGLSPEFKDLVELWLQHPIDEVDQKAVDPRPWARRFNTVLAHHFGKSDTLSYKSAFTETATSAFNLKITDTEQLSRPRQILELLKRLIYNLGFSSIFDHNVNAGIYKQMYGYCEDELQSNQLGDQQSRFREELRKLGEGIYAIHNTYDQ